MGNAGILASTCIQAKSLGQSLWWSPDLAGQWGLTTKCYYRGPEMGDWAGWHPLNGRNWTLQQELWSPSTSPSRERKKNLIFKCQHVLRIYNKTDIGSDSFLLTKADINKLPEKGQIISILSFVDQRVTTTQLCYPDPKKLQTIHPQKGVALLPFNFIHRC